MRFQTIAAQSKDAAPVNERVWKAVAEGRFLQGIVQGQRRPPRNRRIVLGTRLAWLAKRVSLSPQHFRRLLKRVQTGSLARHTGSGRRPKASAKEVEAWMRGVSSTMKGAWTVRSMAALMRAHWGFGSLRTIQLIAARLGFRSVTKRLCPLLTNVNKAKRLEWCRERIARDEPFGGADDIEIHVDEKWFYGARPARKVWIAAGEKRPTMVLPSKQHIPKVMFLGAVAQPKEHHEFDGAIGLYPLAETVPAQRRSSKRARGTPVLKLLNMDAKLFISMLKEKVVPDAVKKCPWARRIVVQMDNAGGHGGGRGDIARKTLKELNDWGRALPPEILSSLADPNKPPEVLFVAQPPHSPDLNVLDLGAWRSMDIAVDEIKRNHIGRQLSLEEIHDAARDAWNSWNGAEKLKKLFETLQMIWPCVVRAEGGNNFDLPHKH